MKKHSLTVLLLIFLMGFGSLCYAQSVVRVTQLGADYVAAPPTVSFRVYWDTQPDNVTHLDSVWLFVDYQPIAANGSLGAWTPATLTNPSATAPGTVIAGSLNGRGFYLKGTPTASFSSTVTVTLDGLNAGDKFNWCAYVTDYPPNATEGAGYYELHGTPPFIINGTITEPTRQYTGCIDVLTDATGGPGLIPVKPAITAFIASPDTICAGSTVTLTATAANASEYSFDGGNSWGAGATLAVAPTQDTTCNVHVRNATGCTVTAAAGAFIKVHPKPVAAFTNPPTAACAGSTVTLTASGGGSYCFTHTCSACGRNPYATGNDAPTEYDCSIGLDSCTFNDVNTYTLTMPDSGSVTVWVRVINDNDCTDSVSVTIGTGTVTPPTPTLAASATYCSGTAIIPFTGEAGYSYQLQNNLLQDVGAPLTGAGASLNFPIAVTGTYAIVVTNVATNCTAVSNAQEVTVHPLPAAPTGASSNARCEAGTVTFSATPPAYCTIDWYTDATDGNIVTGGYGTHTFSPSINASTTYYAQARQTTYGCLSPSRLAVTATVHTAVGAASISGASSNTCPAATVSLSASATGATTFTWYKDGMEVQSGTSSAYTVTSSGSYTVQGKNANCTGTTSSSKVVTISDCRDVPGCTNLKLYQTTSPLDGNTTWTLANDYCLRRGARLPTFYELLCMCANAKTLPGGYEVGRYWSTIPPATPHRTVHIGGGACAYKDASDGETHRFRCVL
jgi:hypothetical protein